MAAMHQHDICPASALLVTGSDNGPWYRTLMPFEHLYLFRGRDGTLRTSALLNP